MLGQSLQHQFAHTFLIVRFIRRSQHVPQGLNLFFFLQQHPLTTAVQIDGQQDSAQSYKEQHNYHNHLPLAADGQVQITFTQVTDSPSPTSG